MKPVPTKQWIKFGIVTALYLLFLLWVKSWWGLVGKELVGTGDCAFHLRYLHQQEDTLELVAQVEERDRA